MSDRLAKKRALITGAASGIGRAIAEVYATEGARVALVDVAAERLDSTHADIDGETLAIECNVRDTSGVDDAVERAVDAWGGLDVVVNNAGVITRRELVDTTDDELERMVDINLNGTLRVARAVIPTLRSNGGNLLNMSSSLSVEAAPNRSVYSATKGGVKSLTQQLAIELAPTVRVNAIAPGTIATPLNERRRSDAAYERRRRETIPLERFGDVSEVADSAVFLTSEEASYVTGHTLFVDGGRSVS